jgi:hypothetical protein
MTQYPLTVKECTVIMKDGILTLGFEVFSNIDDPICDASIHCILNLEQSLALFKALGNIRITDFKYDE